MNKSTVTLKDVYDIVDRLENKFDDQYKDHETRIRGMEAFQNRAFGILSLVAAFSGVITNFIWAKFTGKG